MTTTYGKATNPHVLEVAVRVVLVAALLLIPVVVGVVRAYSRLRSVVQVNTA